MSNFIVNTDIPNLRVVIREGDQYNINIVPGRITTQVTGSFTSYADMAGLAASASYVSGAGIFAEFATSASYADTINRQISGDVRITGSTTITDNLIVTGSATITEFVKSNEYKLNAGTVSITFTGSVNTGILGATEYIQPFISTTEYSGMTVEYLAQRPGACRMGIIMASWLDTASITFTDISTTDIGDTSDITFRFLSGSNELRLRVNSNGSGSGAWTVQSLFKLFPNLNS